MERIAQFKSDFFVTKHGTKDQIEDLKAQILTAKEVDIDPMRMNNENCWRSNTKYKNIEWLTDFVRDATAYACEHYFSHDSTFKELVPERRIGWDYWTNVNEPGSINVMHSHVADSFVAVYYIQGKNTGPLKFVNPANILTNCNPRSPFVRDCLVYPSDGELVLWPGWVPHEVLRNESDRQRINLAFSIQVT
tara:strand:+ start:2237 stop:2812 length:576 start_codon:yes stop_codon:yes gene_type:complete